MIGLKIPFKSNKQNKEYVTKKDLDTVTMHINDIETRLIALEKTMYNATAEIATIKRRVIRITEEQEDNVLW